MLTNCPNYIPILMGLIAFGIGYNFLVERLERQGHDRGYMGLIVAFGCTVTLAGANLDPSYAGVNPILWVFVCFIASGIPMVAGSIARHVRARAKQQHDCLDHNDKLIHRKH